MKNPRRAGVKHDATTSGRSTLHNPAAGQALVARLG